MLLLDTHIFLWYISADARLPASVLDSIRDPDNQVYLSVASVWEAVIKHALGKLELPRPPAVFFPEQRKQHQIESLLIVEETMPYLAELPRSHRDPFDRVLIAQALQHKLTIATVDDAIRSYPVPVLPKA